MSSFGRGKRPVQRYAEDGTDLRTGVAQRVDGRVSFMIRGGGFDRQEYIEFVRKRDDNTKRRLTTNTPIGKLVQFHD